MSSQPHESGIHAVRSGAGEVSVTEVRFPAGTAAGGKARADHDQLTLTRHADLLRERIDGRVGQ
jgi:hypothetical protein